MEAKIARAQLLKQLATSTTDSLLISGPALVGKTTLLKELAQKIRKDDSSKPFVVEFTCSQAHAGYEPLLQAIEELAQRKNWAKSRLLLAVAKWTGIQALTTATGIAKKILPDAVPEEAITALRAGLDAAIKAGSEKPAVLDFPRSEATKLQQHLKQVIEKSGRRLILMIDRLEDLTTPGIRLIQLIADAGVENACILVSVSSESIAFQQRTDIRDLTNSFRKRGTAAIFDLEGHSVETLVQLREANGLKTSISDAEKAYAYSLSGRIGLLEPWLKSKEPDIFLLKPAADRLVAHYSMQYDQLDESNKKLIKCLGATYPEGISIPDTASCLGCKISELEERLRYVSIFAETANSAVALRNRHVVHFLSTQIGVDIVKATYEECFPNLVQEKSSQTNSLPTNLTVALVAMNTQSLLRHAKDDLARGASQAALTWINTWRSWGEKKEDAPLEEVEELLLLEADAYGQLGAYRDSIRILTDLKPVTNAKIIDRSLALAEKFTVIGDHSSARHHLTTVRKIARATDNSEAWVKATARTLKIKNELCEGGSSRLLADKLQEVLNIARLEPRTAALAYRTLARTYVLIPARNNLAIEYAQRSLDIAQNVTKSSRDEGNSLYALADAYRHNGDLRSAMEQYGKSYNLARSMLNHDLELYSLLGQGACQLADANGIELRNIADELVKIVTDENPDEEKMASMYRKVASILTGSPRNPPDTILAIEKRPWIRELARWTCGQSTVQDLKSIKIIL